MNVRVYGEISSNYIKGCNAIYYLSYLKLSTIASKKGGRVYIEKVAPTLGLSSQTSIKHLHTLKKMGFLTLHKGYARIISQSTLLSHKKNVYYAMPEEDLFKFSWQNISEFKATLTEIAIEISERNRRRLAKGFSITNQRDGSREKVIESKYKEFDGLNAISYVSALTGLSTATVSRFKVKQNLAQYIWKLIPLSLIKGYEAEYGFDFESYELKHKGIFIEVKGKIYFSCISSRKSLIRLKYR